MPLIVRAKLPLLAATVTGLFSILFPPGITYSQAPKMGTPPPAYDSEMVQKFKEKKAEENLKKINIVNQLIQNVNEKLKLRTSGQKIFDKKRALENRLRDMITLFGMTEQAMSEAIRLARESEEIRRLIRIGPKNPRRLQLANFLEARRREYILFATR